MTTKNVLVIVDAQNDFITGSLANKVAEERVPNICKLIDEGNFDAIFATLDTHYEDYLETREGKSLPVPHCIKGTWGHEIDDNIKSHLVGKDFTTIEKNTFGSKDLPFEILSWLINLDEKPGDVELNIVVCGFCTDICVISNVLNTKQLFYETSDFTVISDACAGVTEDTHEAALTAMKSCQVNVKTLNEFLS